MNHIQGPLGTSNFGSYYSYKYNEKELQETGMYDYGWRQYFPDLGRWNGMDMLSEQYTDSSPYAYVLNNPVFYFDPDGRISAEFMREIFDSPDRTVWTNDGYGGFSNNWGKTMDYAGNVSDTNMPSHSANESDGIHINFPNIQLQGKSNFFWGLQIQSHVNRYMDWWNGKSDFRWDRIRNAGRYNDGPINYIGGAGDPAGVFDVMMQVLSTWEPENKYLAMAAGIVGAVALKKPGLATKEATGAYYSVAYEMKLGSSSYPGVTRYMHFKEANEALESAMKSNSLLSELGIVVPKFASGSIIGKPPANWVWHHEVNKGVMQLVPKSQHPNVPGGIFWETMHPGRKGGFSIWGKK